MYTKKIVFEKYLPQYNTWIRDSLKVTNDSLWIHLCSLQINNNIRAITVSDLT